ncbi:hypothetical protein HK098_003123 [Nowakowskiella sp. JEL0407]|nr:hypothetical protein HK098_003123 [Nowakowskiella sp. JEL0407]
MTTVAASSVLPPVAKKVDFSHVYHGREFPDPYHWLKDQDPEKKRDDILQYLKLENKHTDSILEPTKELSETLYNEFVGRIQGKYIF